MAPDPMIEEAARWRVRLEAGQATAADLEAWLAGDPRRRAAFARVQGIWDVFDEGDASPALLRVRQDLRRRFRMAPRRRPGLAAAVAAACVAAAAVLITTLAGVTDARLYEAPSHERETIRLADGSVVLLDAGSRLRVHYWAHHRDLALEKGQARFEVAHDASRPFVVRAGPRRVIATGTVFDIDLQSRSVAVALLQGKVRIVSARRLGPIPAEVDLRQGEEYRDAPGGGGVSRFDPEAVTAWETGHLVLNDLPLAVAVRRVNRYADRPIVADGGVAGLRVSGVFNAGDVRAFAEAVTAVLPVEARCRADGVILLSPRPERGNGSPDMGAGGSGACG